MSTIDQTAAHYDRQTEKRLREQLRNKFGARKYRITGSCRWHDDVHAFGQMPNSTETGWYLLGTVRDVCRELGV